MDIIKCNHCGKEINDDSNFCPQCGNDLKTEVIENENITENEEMIPDEKLETITEEIKEPLSKKKPSKKGIIITAIVLVLMIVVGVVMGVALHNKKLVEEAERIRTEYEANLRFAYSEMLVGAANAEEVTNLISAVWHNAIWEERDDETDKFTRPDGYFVDDFNDALDNLFADSSFADKQYAISSNKYGVTEAMKALMTPVEGYEVAYEKISQLYDAYIELINMALNPTGSYNSYTESSNNAVTNFLKCYNAAELYIK